MSGILAGLDMEPHQSCLGCLYQIAVSWALLLSEWAFAHNDLSIWIPVFPFHSSCQFSCFTVDIYWQTWLCYIYCSTDKHGHRFIYWQTWLCYHHHDVSDTMMWHHDVCRHWAVYCSLEVHIFVKFFPLMCSLHVMYQTWIILIYYANMIVLTTGFSFFAQYFWSSFIIQ